jgi:hypothetical protein
MGGCVSPACCRRSLLSDTVSQSRTVPSCKTAGRSLLQRRWARVGWNYSLILPLGKLLLVATFLITGPGKDLLEIRVASSTSGEIIPGALVTVGPYSYVADEDGRVIIERPEDGSIFSARFDGFSPVEQPLTSDTRRSQTIQMQPSIVNGVLLDAGTGRPIEGAEITLRDGAGIDVAETRTDYRGAYVFKNIPDSAVLHINAGPYGQRDEPVKGRHRVDFQLTRKVAYQWLHASERSV